MYTISVIKAYNFNILISVWIIECLINHRQFLFKITFQFNLRTIASVFYYVTINKKGECRCEGIGNIKIPSRGEFIGGLQNNRASGKRRGGTKKLSCELTQTFAWSLWYLNIKILKCYFKQISLLFYLFNLLQKIEIVFNFIPIQFHIC